MSGYRNGADLERAAKHHLEDNGYYVIKSGGSKGVVDLAAFKPDHRLFVQCKLTGYLTPVEREALYALACQLHAWPVVAKWEKIGTAARFVEFGRLVPHSEDFGAAPVVCPWSPDHGIADAHATARALPQGGIG